MLQPADLREFIFGSGERGAQGSNNYRAAITTRIGPIKATFKGRVDLTEMDEPNSVVLTGAGEGGVAGFAKGEARITLSDGGMPGASILEYEGDVVIGG